MTGAGGGAFRMGALLGVRSAAMTGPIARMPSAIPASAKRFIGSPPFRVLICNKGIRGRSPESVADMAHLSQIRPRLAPRLLAGGLLAGAERIGQAGAGGAGRKRLLLAFVGRPARQVDDLESRADAAVRVDETREVDVGHSLERCPPQRPPAPLDE